MRKIETYFEAGQLVIPVQKEFEENISYQLHLFRSTEL